MKNLAVIFFVFMLTSCSSRAQSNQSTTDNILPSATKSLPLAIYYIHGNSEITSHDLQQHPEVIVVQSFGDLKRYANQKIALWVDKGATPLTSDQQEWLNQPPQAYYPMVLVGSSDPLHSFRDLLGLCCFMGPAPDPTASDVPGFSVVQRKETSDPASPEVSFIQGYNQPITVESIFQTTNVLMKGGLNVTPTGTFISPSTPTAVP